MRLLLDTHTFIWWDSEPSRLSATALNLCSDPENEILLSVASLWEMQIKHQLGKLTLRLALQEIVAHQQERNAVIVLPISPTHVYTLANLPSAHKDPFDRLLVAQATTEGVTLLSTDPVFDSYPVKVVW